MPRRTVDAIDEWLAERTRTVENRRALTAQSTDPLIVRADNRALSPQALDRLVRGLAGRVVLPCRGGPAPKWTV